MQKRIEAISPAVMKGLTAWDWPGNIRELENFIERAVIVTRGKSLEAPVGELRKTNTVAFPHADQHHVEPRRRPSPHATPACRCKNFPVPWWVLPWF
jgi:DNA-binding NtrC family response regulator